VQVKNPEELEAKTGELLENAAQRDALGRAALEVVAENLGAVERTVEMILPSLERRGIFVHKKK
jgi:3-deoxy-D-manno-octulosonic-acid transferase